MPNFYSFTERAPGRLGPQAKLVADQLRVLQPATAKQVSDAVKATGSLKTRQPVLKVVAFYLSEWKRQGLAVGQRERKADVPPTLDADSTHSTLRERIVEHIFVGEALRLLWRKGILDVEVLHSEFDGHGYDLVLARGSIVRHIQFKTGTTQTPGKVSVARALAEKPSGCVIWIRLTPSLDLDSFFWFGSEPGNPLPSIDAYPYAKRLARNKKGERPLRQNYHHVPGKAFIAIGDAQGVLEKLFGAL